MSKCEMFRSDYPGDRMAEIVPLYQQAFAGEPWREVSKCADKQQPPRCVGAMSRLMVVSTCEVCRNVVTLPAYPSQELERRFRGLSTTRPTTWYLCDRNQGGLQVAAVAWGANADRLWEEKYPDVPEMAGWLGNRYGNQTIVPQMLRVAERDFGTRAVILPAGEGVSDRRAYVEIDLQGERL